MEIRSEKAWHRMGCDACLKEGRRRESEVRLL
jgi:hypothetical protein